METFTPTQKSHHNVLFQFLLFVFLQKKKFDRITNLLFVLNTHGFAFFAP